MNTRSSAILAVFAIGLVWFVAQHAAAADAPADAQGAADHASFSILIVDPEGKPVEGAHVGQSAGRGMEDKKWYFFGFMEDRGIRPAVTDEQGKTALFLKDIHRDKIALVARHAERKLVGFKTVSKSELTAAAKESRAIEIAIENECHVRGAIASQGLAKLGQELGWTNATIEVDGCHLFQCDSQSGEYEFFLPKGSYRLRTYGSKTHFKHMDFTVPERQTDFALERVDLVPTKLTSLTGQPAPELREIVAWKNSAPVKLADLRGKYVLLEFWGYWCGPCVHRMPLLFDLHDKFSKRGLVVIGVHVGTDNDSIDTVEKLDAELKETRRELWKDRDLPFAVAMASTRRVKYEGSDQEGRSQASVDYGVQFYPTQILIDPAGKVLGEFDEIEHVKLLEQLPAAAEARDAASASGP